MLGLGIGLESEKRDAIKFRPFRVHLQFVNTDFDFMVLILSIYPI